MTVPTITAVRLTGSAHRAELPLLVLGPSLGTSAATLWTECAAGLTDVFDVVAWDLPGHGYNHSVARGVVHDGRARPGGARACSTRSSSSATSTAAPSPTRATPSAAAVGLQLLLDHPDRVRSAVLLCTGAKIGSESMWAGRVGQVSVSGTSVMVVRLRGAVVRSGLPRPRTRDRRRPCCTRCRTPTTAATSRSARRWPSSTSATGSGEIGAPVLAVAGSTTSSTPTASLREIADGVQDGRLVELLGVAHLAPAEEPAEVARLIRQHVLGEVEPEPPSSAYDAGMAVRREVLGDAHVDRATAGATDLTREFQELITEYAWGRIWTRPGLDRRSRSLITLTALIARGHHEELAMHLRAARTNGVTDDEIKELILQSAIYCGVPDANTAFRIAQRVLAELDGEGEA